MTPRKKAAERDLWNRYWGWYALQPLPAERGPNSPMLKGDAVKSWWAGRWVRALTQWINPTRLARGKTYARRGQVVDLDIHVGMIRAHVQGTQPVPYRVEIEVTTLSDHEWERAIEAMASQASYAAQLLNGQMPREIEEVFSAVGISLFPTSRGDLRTACSCPDPANPCKHIAAVYLLVGEMLDQDPFLLFQMHGRTQDQIMAALRGRRAEHVLGPMQGAPSALERTERGTAALDAEETLERFWRLDPAVLAMEVHVRPPEVEMEVVKMLGPLPAALAASEEELAEIYRTVSHQALAVAFRS